MAATVSARKALSPSIGSSGVRPWRSGGPGTLAVVRGDSLGCRGGGSRGAQGGSRSSGPAPGCSAGAGRPRIVDIYSGRVSTVTLGLAALFSAGFARRRDRADAVFPHVRRRHGHAGIVLHAWSLQGATRRARSNQRRRRTHAAFLLLEDMVGDLPDPHSPPMRRHHQSRRFTKRQSLGLARRRVGIVANAVEIRARPAPSKRRPSRRNKAPDASGSREGPRTDRPGEAGIAGDVPLHEIETIEHSSLHHAPLASSSAECPRLQREENQRPAPATASLWNGLPLFRRRRGVRAGRNEEGMDIQVPGIDLARIHQFALWLALTRPARLWMRGDG